MATYDLKGISFLFRVSVQGGVTMSVANTSEVTHILEGMQQCLLTGKNERGMRYTFYSELKNLVWEPNNNACKSLFIYYIVDCLTRLMGNRISINSTDVSVTQQDNELLGVIGFTVNSTSLQYIATLKVGDTTNGT